ncbi:MinD/ParA family protein [Desulfoplanes sp.]
MSTTNTTMSMSIVSGKGGVGKTNLSLNLGYALSQLGHRLLIMDADLGLANMDVLLGISPQTNIQDIITRDVPPEDVVVGVNDLGLDLLPAASGIAELVELDEDVQSLLLHKLDTLFHGYDYLMLDLGAGISPTVLSFASMSQERIVILTPEPTSLTDSYALIKILAGEHGVKTFQVIVNMAGSQQEAKQTFDRLYEACHHFLQLKIQFLGMVRHDPTVTQSVRRQEPLLQYAPHSPAALDIHNIAQSLHRQRTALGQLIARSSILKPRYYPDQYQT